MLRNILILSVSSVMFVCGCQPNSPKPYLQTTVDATEIEAGTGYSIPGAGEIDLVEDLVSKRNAYYSSLNAISEFYAKTGNGVKYQWVQNEIEGFALAPQYRYIRSGEVAGESLKATNAIEAADQLYDDAYTTQKKAMLLGITVDESGMRDALNMYESLIEQYPSSDKVDDAAFRLGEIYQDFKDYEIANIYYQRATQWDAQTPYPARYRRAYVLDKYLLKYDDALTMYLQSIDKESQYGTNSRLAKERVLELTKNRASIDAKAEIDGVDPVYNDGKVKRKFK